MEFYDDYYDEDEYENDEDYESGETAELNDEVRTFGSVYETCVQPSIAASLDYILMLLVCSLCCRLAGTCIRHLRPQSVWVQHTISVICGFAVLYSVIGHEFLIVLLFAICAYVLLLVIEYHKWRSIGRIVSAVISATILLEFLSYRPDTWGRIRGIQMVAVMKIISLAYDLETLQAKREAQAAVPGLVPYLGYIFCPSTCLLGPWIPYKAYVYSLGKASKNFRWILCTLLNAALAIFFLSLSNCYVPLICEDTGWLLLRMYRDALTVRCSHYFICYLSQMTLSAAGVTLRADNGAKHSLLGDLVCNPLLIEWPRSLSSIVRNWNINMHDWLKLYVFRAVHTQFGSYFFAIISTYLVSSLLHGMHWEIYVVLLSLGLFAYIENVLRDKLASIFNACITANACRKPCKYVYCAHNWSRSTANFYVLLVNAFFALLAALQLAYLGIIMNSSTSNDGANYRSIYSSLEQWTQLSYFSHWIAFAMYLFHLLI